VLALKNTVCPKILTVLNIPFTLGIFERFVHALKNRVALKIFIVLKYFYHTGFLSNLRLP